MRRYDIALVLVRVLAATNFIVAAASAVFSCIRFAISINVKSKYLNPGFIISNSLGELTFPFEELISGVLILIFAKNIARFASKVAENSERF
jgi:hypothetical protein